MSVLDQFRDAEQRVAQRLKELEPAVAEYRELETIAQRLGIDRKTPATAGSGTAPARARAPRRTRRQRAKSSRSGVKTTSAAKPALPRARRAPGQREQQVLELVRERPGITVAEAGKTLGVDPTGLYRVVHRLEQRGEVVKNGRKLEPARAASAR